MGADILPQLVDWLGWRELFARHPDRRLRPAGLELSGAGRRQPRAPSRVTG